MKIILTRGLPGSGKSTWSKQYIKESGNSKRINKDDLRAMLDDGKWSKRNESFVLEQRDFLVTTSLLNGFNVIIDDTNLHPKHEIRMKELAEALNQAHHANEKFEPVVVEIKDFTDVPMEECIKRDLKRFNSVGEGVIRKMYDQFLKPKPPKVIHNQFLPDAIICDIDGTLALFGDNNPYDRNFLDDEINEPIWGIIDNFRNNYKCEILLVSGRVDKFRDQTLAWLKNNEVEYGQLFMRKTDDMRKDVIVKQEIYSEHIKDKYNIRFVLDDRDQVVEFWRSQGLTCLQVAEGAF